MTTPMKIDDLFHDFSPADRGAVDARARVLRDEYNALQALRKLHKRTQSDIAKKLKVSQADVSLIEQRSDLLLSTLRKYVEACGGDLRILVRLPDVGDVELTSFGAELGAAKKKARPRGKARAGSGKRRTAALTQGRLHPRDAPS